MLFYERGQNLHRLVSVSEYDEVVPKQIVVYKHISTLIGLLQGFENVFRGLPAVQLVLVAGLQICGDHRGRIAAQIAVEYLLRDIIVIKFVVAERNVGIDSQELSIFKQQLLVDIGGLLEMAAQEMNGGEAQVIDGHLFQLMMVGHQVLFIALLMRNVKHQPVLQRAFRSLLRLPLSFIILIESIETARLVIVKHFIVVLLLHHLVVHGYGFSRCV